MPKTARFEFIRTLTPSGFIYVPLARVEIRRGRRAVELEMTIDSGADLSMIPYQVGLALGLRKERAALHLSGVAGGVPYLLKRLRFRLGPFTFAARVAWAQQDDVPLLLGRADIFSRFVITFDERRKTVIFKE